jgi:hypothetical protein
MTNQELEVQEDLASAELRTGGEIEVMSPKEVAIRTTMLAERLEKLVKTSDGASNGSEAGGVSITKQKLPKRTPDQPDMGAISITDVSPEGESGKESVYISAPLADEDGRYAGYSYDSSLDFGLSWSEGDESGLVSINQARERSGDADEISLHTSDGTITDPTQASAAAQQYLARGDALADRYEAGLREQTQASVSEAV